MRIGHTADLVIGLAFAGLGSAIFMVASGFRTFPGMAVSSGLFPKITGTGMIVFGIVMALAAARAARRQTLAPHSGQDAGEQALPTRYAMTVVVALLVLIFAMPIIGFLASGFVFSAFLVRLGGGRWPGALAFALLATIAVYIVFTYGLRVPLPRGPF
ncbi:tripartite tricarboxylate transporter TctB family protein [Stappia sp. ES.058]|uniref:tripartite tricarboxylate transporter TctB family protein n=1 Tax=Stappia sp. ES.058 TaxID=1881061 RepID=UPI00087C3DAF|nr:tripartite tricarboxylate transporter TctB family protein [Stappia sp. ES.058]SDU33064.1 Tripartite tricarboxylate transporter TctB family protein [Stappia sp. ES.058]